MNGGTIWDKIGNPADMAHEAVSADVNHRVDAPDATGPMVSSFAIVSDPGDDGTYAIGDEIRVSVQFNEDLNVSGDPQLKLEIGGEAGTAAFESSEGSTMFFAYTVAEGDEGPDGIAIGSESMSLNGGSIEDASENAANLEHEAVPADERHLIDGVRPGFASAETSEDGAEVFVNFSEDVSLSPVLGLLGAAVDIQQRDLFRAVVSLTVDGHEVIASDAVLSGGTLTLVLPSEVTDGQEVTVTFDNVFAAEGIPVFMDGAGNGMSGFDSQPVVNLSTALAVANSMEDATSVVLSETLIELDEGDSVTYTLALSSRPSEDVMVNITRTPYAPLALPFLTMTFTPENWDEPQAVTIEAESDDNSLNHLTFLNHTAHGGGYDLETAELRVVIKDSEA